MSDSSRTRIIFYKETVFSETPPANVATKLLRFTKSSLEEKNITVVSEEIRSDRQRTDHPLVGFDASGDITMEAIYASHLDDFLEAALCGTWTSDVLVNGTTNRSFCIEQGHLDIGKYFRFHGEVVNKLALVINTQKIVQVTTSFMGARADAASVSIAGTTTPTAETTNEPMRAGDLIQLSAVGGSNYELDVVSATALTMDILNNVRRHDVINAYALDSFGYGVMDITGTLNTYLKDIAIFNQYVTDGLFSLAFKMVDPLLVTANSYVVTIPRIKVSAATQPITGVDADVMQGLTWQALYDPGVGYTIHIGRNVNYP